MSESLEEQKKEKIEIDDIEKYVWESDGDYVKPKRWSELSPEEQERFAERIKEIADKVVGDGERGHNNGE